MPPDSPAPRPWAALIMIGLAVALAAVALTVTTEALNEAFRGFELYH